MYSHLAQHLDEENEIDPYYLKENNLYFVYNTKKNNLMLVHFKEFAYEHVYDELVNEDRIRNEMSEFPGMIRQLLEEGPEGLFFTEIEDAIPIGDVKIYNYKKTMKNYETYKKKINMLLEKKRGHKISSEIVNFLFKSNKLYKRK